MMLKANPAVIILMVFLSLDSGSSFAQKTEVAPDGIEVYMGGRKFQSLGDYQKKRELDAVVISPGTTTDPVFGKTLIISSEGTVISTSMTLDGGKTIDVKVPGRVAGIEPSFRQVTKDFDANAGTKGVKPQTVSSPEDFDEQLRKKLREHHRPVLLISDKKRVRVLELDHNIY
ncbi:MAG: hypothetical protein WCO69_02350 [Candidatus Omnitrophota bacterium]